MSVAILTVATFLITNLVAERLPVHTETAVAKDPCHTLLLPPFLLAGIPYPEGLCSEMAAVNRGNACGGLSPVCRPSMW
jgi:hypothetical protein